MNMCRYVLRSRARSSLAVEALPRTSPSTLLLLLALADGLVPHIRLDDY